MEQRDEQTCENLHYLSGNLNDLSSLRDRSLCAFSEGAIDNRATMDHSGRFLEANPAVCQDGLAQTERLGENFRDFCQPECDFVCEWRKQPEQKRNQSQLAMEGRNDGLQNWHLLTNIEQRALLTAILDGTRDLIAALDLDFRFIAFNRAYHQEFLKIFGYDIQIGTSLIDALAALPQEQQNAIELWGRALNGEEFTVTQEFGDRSRDRRCYEITYSLVRDSQGQRIGASHIVRDVTQQQAAQRERDRTEALLRESEANLAAAQRVAHIGNWRFNAVTGQITWSEELFRIYGLDPAKPEPDLEAHILLIHPDDRHLFQSTVERALSTGEPYIIEFKALRIDGSICIVEGRGEAIRSDEGRVVGLFGTAQDITDRKRLENALRLQSHRDHTLNQFLQMIRQSLDLSILFPAAAAAIAELSDADRVEIVQYLPEQQIWRNVCDYRVNLDLPSAWGIEIPDAGNEIAARLKCREIVRIDDASQIQDTVNPELSEQFPGSWLLVPIQTTTTVWGALSLVKTQCYAFWQNADLEMLLTVANQLTIAIQQSELQTRMRQLNATLEQQMQARTAELQAALFFEAALKRLTDAVRDSLEEGEILQTVVEELALTLDVCSCDIAFYNEEHTASTIYYDFPSAYPSFQGQTLTMNDFPEAYAQLLQGNSLHFCHRPDSSSNLRPHLANSTIFACPLMDNQRVLGDLWLYKSSGAVFNEMEIRLVQQMANQCAIALRQSRLYQMSQSYAKELEILNQHKDDVLTTVTHELRAPLANIKMSTQMLEILLTTKQSMDYKTEHYFKILKQECDRETRLINDLLDLSRIESGQLQLDRVSIDLAEYLPQVAAPFEQRMAEQSQVFQLDLATEFPSLFTDASYLQRVLAELLHNACKYTPSGETITLSAQVNLGTTGDRLLQISVTNTGTEIAPHEQERIFEKFYRIPGQDYRKAGGTGLGLALIKKLTHCLGGEIRLKSAASTWRHK